VYHGNNETSPLSPNRWPNPDIYYVQPFYKPWVKIPTYHKPWPRVRMSILALGRKQKIERKRENSWSKESEESKKRKFPIKDWEKAKRKKIPDQRSEENRRNMQKGLWTRQYLNNTELSPSKQEKKGNHDLKWSSPFDCQPKSCASVTCLPHTKQKQKRKRPRTLKAKFPTKKNKPFPRKSPIDPWSRM